MIRKKTSEALFAAGNAQWHAGRPQRALKLYCAAARALCPQSPVPHKVDVMGGLALALCETGRFSEALAVYPGIRDFCEAESCRAERILRQWAKALEQTNDLARAREVYGAAEPDDRTSDDDRCKWHHALGLLEWRDGRLQAARKHLEAATACLPKDDAGLVPLLGMLGNDALLSLELGDIGRAMRLMDRMLAVRGRAGKLTLSNEILTLKIEAALAARRNDPLAGIARIKAGMALLERRAPDDWMRRLDMANEYVTAAQGTVCETEAIADLQAMTDAAPDEVSWVSRFLLARLRIGAGETGQARNDLEAVFAAVIGSGSPESEIELFFETVRLTDQEGQTDATILLGKMALTFLLAFAPGLDHDALTQILRVGAEVSALSSQALRSAARFEEAQAIEALSERVTRRVALMQRADGVTDFRDPVPLTPGEEAAIAEWLAARQEIATARADAGMRTARDISARALTALLTYSGAEETHQGLELPRPQQASTLRLGLVAQGADYLARFVTSEGDRFAFPTDAATLNRLIGELRSAVDDPQDWVAPAEKVYRILIAPVAHLLDTRKHIEIDATSVLGRVPIGLLHDGGPLLSERVTIRYVMPTIPRDRKVQARSGTLHCAGFAGVLARIGAFQDAAPPVAPVRTLTARDFDQNRFLAALAARPTYLSLACHLDSAPAQMHRWALWLGTDEPLFLSDFGRSDYDLEGIEVAVLATCSSGQFDATDRSRRSLAGLVLDKGVHHVIGTLWDISETAAAQFLNAFWTALAANPGTSPEIHMARIQRRAAQRCRAKPIANPDAGGIGAPPAGANPGDWAAFVLFTSGNTLQQTGVSGSGWSATDQP